MSRIPRLEAVFRSPISSGRLKSFPDFTPFRLGNIKNIDNLQRFIFYYGNKK